MKRFLNFDFVFSIKSYEKLKIAEWRVIDQISFVLDVLTISDSDILPEIVETSKNWILDVDLDCFSTQDPFKKLVGAEILEEIRDIYPKDCLSERNSQTLSDAQVLS